jgi:6,7-dimethyl-8-ribityllumazine synthase
MPESLPPIAIVVSRYNESITEKLFAGAVMAYTNAGGRERDIKVVEAAGAFELVALSMAAADCGQFAGVIALGCIIKGETKHDEYLAHAVTQGLANISLVTGIPVGLGVLTVNNAHQARDRAGGKLGNKGAEAMNALLMSIAQIAQLKGQRRSVSIEGMTLPDKAADKQAASKAKARRIATPVAAAGGKR